MRATSCPGALGTVGAGLARLRLSGRALSRHGRGARDIARLMIEMRQGATETPDPWDRDISNRPVYRADNRPVSYQEEA